MFNIFFVDNDHPDRLNHNIKHLTSQKQEILRDFLNGTKFANSSCPHCKLPKRPLRAEQHSKVYFSKGLRRSQAEKLLVKKQKDRREAWERKR